MKAPDEKLARTITLPLLLFYGLGNILGAGIYVLIGEVAGAAGMYAPFAFGVALLIAAFTALSYSELVGRFPVAAGAAAYIREGLGSQRLGVLTGLTLSLAGLVSAATIARGFAGYLNTFFPAGEVLPVICILLLLGGVAAWGIRQSVLAASVLTVVEIGGLLLVIAVGSPVLGELPQRYGELLPPLNAIPFEAILTGAFIAFYAFLGFEDMVNIAEEVRDPARTFRVAILTSLFVASLLYIAVAVIGVLLLSPHELGSSDAPFAAIYHAATGEPTAFISIIGIFAIINGALIQLIMASRMVYGMSAKGWLPSFFNSVHPRTQTPLVATAAVTGIALAFALWLPLVTLANLTSTLILLVFTLINLSLIRIKRRDPAPEGVRTVGMWIPITGLALNLLFLLHHSGAL